MTTNRRYPSRRQPETKPGETLALLGLGHGAMFTGDAVKAGALAEESLAVERTLGDYHLVAQALLLVAWQATNAGNYKRAEALGTEVLGLCRTL